MTARPLRLGISALVLAAGPSLLACSSEADRPSRAAWEARWQSTRTLVPEAEEVLAEGEEVCGSFLGEVRSRREDLLPAPTEVLDDTVSAWLADAEAVGLDCADDEEQLRQRLDDLEVLESQIDAGLEAGAEQ